MPELHVFPLDLVFFVPFFNPLADVLPLEIPCVDHRLGVQRIGVPQIEVMSAIFDHDRHQSGGQGLGDARASPWVQVPVAERRDVTGKLLRQNGNDQEA